LGISADYRLAVAHCGEALAARKIAVVYGGCDQGLMKILADSALSAGGEVIGVIPKNFVADGLAASGITSLIEVDSLHERKQRMADLSDAFIVLPGGAGTTDEMFDAFTSLLLGFHRKPVGVLNVCGYFDGLLHFLKHMESQQFLPGRQLDMLIVERDFDPLLARLLAFVAPPGPDNPGGLAPRTPH
jgi:hypothetical protein